MLTRISLIVAIVAGLAIGGLSILKLKPKIETLNENLRTETEAHKKFEKDFNFTKRSLEKTNAILKQTETELAATKEERDTAVAKAANEGKRADKLKEALN